MIADRINGPFASGVALAVPAPTMHIQVSIGLAMSSPTSLSGDQARSARGRLNRRRRARRLRSFDSASRAMELDSS